jgi:nucleotide-binding universal stress UspA family protein
MTYRNILVQIDAPEPIGRYEIAADLAARGGGRLTGLYLKTDLIAELADAESAGDLPPADLVQRIRDHRRRESESAAAAIAALEQVVAAAQVECDCRVINGDSPRDMITEARHADLVVLGPASLADTGGAFAVDVVVGGGAPVLLAPATTAMRRVGSHVLVAWNGSLESSRALRDALPILTDAAVLELRIAQRKHDRTDTASLVRYLERHGCRPSLQTVEDEGQSIPKWLISEALRTECDLIVMGVYGHARLGEFVLSDVSRQMLLSSPLPLLISA